MLAAAVGSLVVLGIVATATPALASVSSPAGISSQSEVSMPASFTDGIYCGGDTCVEYGGTGASGAIIYYAAGSVSLYGYFRALGPDGFKYTSPTRTWEANGLYNSGAGDFTIPHPVKGYYCVTGYESNGTNVGRRCEYNS
jgi:hypothetical protein